MNFSVIAIPAGVLTGAYLVGAIPFGFIIGKCHGKDIRKEGSGNIGATNVTRVIGKWWGKFCFLLDFLKGLAAVLCALCVSAKFPAFSEWLPPVAVFAVVAGHMFPVYLGFKGGKGISTAAGALAGLCWPAVLIALVVWVIVFELGRYVSLASIIAALVLPFAAIGVKYIGYPVSWSACGLIILLAVIAILKHRSNIKRLLNGTENRFDKGEKK